MPVKPSQNRRGSYGPQAKLTPELVKIIKYKHLVEGITMRALAREHGMHPSGISRAINDYTYQPFREK